MKKAVLAVIGILGFFLAVSENEQTFFWNFAGIVMMATSCWKLKLFDSI